MVACVPVPVDIQEEGTEHVGQKSVSGNGVFTRTWALLEAYYLAKASLILMKTTSRLAGTTVGSHILQLRANDFS